MTQAGGEKVRRGEVQRKCHGNRCLSDQSALASEGAGEWKATRKRRRKLTGSRMCGTG